MFILFSLFDIFFNYSLIRSALVCTLFCLSMHVFNLKKVFFFKRNNLPLPPGPFGLPFLGYLPFLKNDAHLQFTELSKKYGPIYQLKLGGTRVVVLTSAKHVREAFRQQVLYCSKIVRTTNVTFYRIIFANCFHTHRCSADDHLMS